MSSRTPIRDRFQDPFQDHLGLIDSGSVAGMTKKVTKKVTKKTVILNLFQDRFPVAE
jgi:hypothetical protein